MSTQGLPPPALQKAYDRLAAIVVDGEHSLVGALHRALATSEFNALASALVDVFDRHGRLMELFELLISTEVAGTTSAGTLFRNNSLASKAMSCIARYPESHDFLNRTLGSVVREISAGGYGSLEIDPDVAAAGTDVAANTTKLLALAQRVLDCILASADACPAALRQLCVMLKTYCAQKFPESALTSVGGLINLRFFCPAIVTPENYGLVGDGPSIEARRTLVLMSKMVQNLSNHVAFREGFMSVLNTFLTTNQQRMDAFLDAVSTPAPAGTAAAAAGNATTVQPQVSAESYYAALHTVGTLAVRVKSGIMLQLTIADPARKKEFLENLRATTAEIQAAGDDLGTADSKGGSGGSSNSGGNSGSAGGRHEGSSRQLSLRRQTADADKGAKEEKKRREREQKSLEKKQKELQKMEKDMTKGHRTGLFEELMRTRNEVRVQALLIAGKQMCLAADTGNIAVIEEWLGKDKKYVNAKDHEDQTVLHHACTNGHLNIVRLLLRERADCYLADNRGWTALHCAAVEGHLDIVVELCMHRHIDVTATNDDENTPLHYLARIPYVPLMDKILAMFLAGGADVNALNTNLETPLHMAVWKNNLGMVSLLLRNGADPNIRNIKDSSPWDWAVVAQNHDFITLFESVAKCTTAANKSASSSVTTSSSGAAAAAAPVAAPSGPEPQMLPPSPSHSQSPSPQPLSPSQSAGAGQLPQAQTQTATQTMSASEQARAAKAKALWDAIRGNQADRVRELVGEDRTLADTTYGPTRNTVLHVAVPYGNVPVLRVLLRAVSGVETNTLGQTPLMTALWQGSEEVALLLLLSRHRLDTGARYGDGNTALHQAVLAPGRYTEMIVFALVERGADVNAANQQLETPLHLAVRGGSTAVVRALVDCGALVARANRLRETPLDLARKLGLAALVPVLQEAAAAEQRRAAPVTPPVTPPATLPRDGVVAAAAAAAAAATTPTPPGTYAFHQSRSLVAMPTAGASDAVRPPQGAYTPPPPQLGFAAPPPTLPPQQQPVQYQHAAPSPTPRDPALDDLQDYL